MLAVWQAEGGRLALSPSDPSLPSDDHTAQRPIMSTLLWGFGFRLYNANVPERGNNLSNHQ